MNRKKNRAFVMDRDGTLIRDADYLDNPSKIHIYNGVLPALRRLNTQGWKIIVGTNQSGIGRGYFSHATVRKIHDRLLALCRKGGARIDKIYYCPHRPGQNCACRKPKLGMIRAAKRDFNLDLKRSIVVGDKKCDVDWGRAAGTKSVLVRTGNGRKASPSTVKRADHVALTLAHAVRWALEQ